MCYDKKTAGDITLELGLARVTSTEHLQVLLHNKLGLLVQNKCRCHCLVTWVLTFITLQAPGLIYVCTLDIGTTMGCLVGS